MPTGHYNRKPRSPYPLKLRKAYWSMMDRCYLKTYIDFKSYGGRGVIVCEEWKGKINAFCEWAMKNGWQEGLQLDKDIKGNGLLYSPGTCCFITPKENSNNRRDNIKILHDGKMLSVSEVSELTGIKVSTIYYRHHSKKQKNVEQIRS